MRQRRIFTGIVLLSITAILTSPALVSAQEHPAANVLSEVMRAIQGKPCPLISDTVGNAGTNPVDFKNLFVVNDETNVYFLVEVAGDASENVSLPIFLDTDIDQTTGCNFGIPRFNGVEYAASSFSLRHRGYVRREHDGVFRGLR